MIDEIIKCGNKKGPEVAKDVLYCIYHNGYCGYQIKDKAQGISYCRFQLKRIHTST